MYDTGGVHDGGTLVHAQVQTTTLGTNGGQPTRGAGRRGAAVGQISANDR